VESSEYEAASLKLFFNLTYGLTVIIDYRSMWRCRSTEMEVSRVASTEVVGDVHLYLRPALSYFGDTGRGNVMVVKLASNSRGEMGSLNRSSHCCGRSYRVEQEGRSDETLRTNQRA
jgi:hypothetical protein